MTASNRSPKSRAVGISSAEQNFDRSPDAAEVRLPVVQALYACSASTVWRRVRSGLIPAPKRRGGICSWSVGELRRAKAEE